MIVCKYCGKKLANPPINETIYDICRACNLEEIKKGEA